MSDSTLRQRQGFASFWPWPGVAFLVLFAAWLFYMGFIAEVRDVRTAFLGLGAVTCLLIVFALRAARRNAAHAARPRRGSSRADEPAMSRRSAIPDGVEEAETPYGAPAAAGAAAGFSSTRSDAQPSENASGRETAGAHDDNVAHLRPGRQALREVESEDDMTPRDEETPAEPASAGRALPAGVAPETLDVAAAIKQLEALVNREKAERGAQIARLDAAVKERAEAANGNVGLEEKLNNYLTIPAFNNAMNQKVFPRIEQILKARLDEALSAEALREKIGPTAGSGGAETATLEALNARIDEARALREALRAEVASLRKTVEDLAARPGPAGTGDDGAALAELREARQADREAIAGLKASLAEVQKRAEEGGGEDQRAGPNGLMRLRRGMDALSAELRPKVDGANRAVEELRASVGALGEEVARMGEAQRTLSERLESLPAAAAGESATAEPGVQSEVDALRDALTTIIEQNREIRAQQDVLTAKFDAPARAGAQSDRR